MLPVQSTFPEPDPVALLRRQFVKDVLALYAATPGTLGVRRRPDRVLAAELFDRGVALAVVDAAFILATARRSFRPPPPLGPVRSLHYYLPVIEECLASPIDPAYLAYLRRKISRLP